MIQRMRLNAPGLLTSLLFGTAPQLALSGTSPPLLYGFSGPDAVAINSVDKNYLPDLQRRLKRAWVPPTALPNQQVTVLFKIVKTGAVSNIRLEAAGSDATWARPALQAVENAAPFKTLPDTIESAELGYKFGYVSFAH